MSTQVSLHGRVLALLVVLAGSALGFLVLDPGLGFDDANITLNYAHNLAGGHGYVYFVGGERVEGSTSPLWTAANVAVVLLPGRAEFWLSLLGGLIAWSMIVLSMRAALELATVYGLARERIVETLVGLCYLALPATIGWLVWSLMDIGLWILLISTAFWLSVRLSVGAYSRPDVTGFVIVLLLLPLARPEGIAAAVGFGILVLISSIASGNRQAVWPASLGVAAAVLGFLALLLARWSYFGEFVPNTYYAKTTTDLGEQIAIGFDYFFDYLKSPVGIALLVFMALLPFNAKRRGGVPSNLPLAMAIATILAGVSVYIALGGDHFGSFRFFQFIYPIALPFVVISILLLWPGGTRSEKAWTHRHVILTILIFAAFWGRFVDKKGGYDHEFRISEEGRAIGRLLNDYPNQPSVGTIPAGGISVTYEGPIYDLLGLNWVAMARAGRDDAPSFINHGGFDPGVFYATLPEIVHPQLQECDEDAYQNQRFANLILNDLFKEAEFNALYDFDCWRGVRFYRLKAVPSASG